MSTRQMRRLQELVDRATGLDASASDEEAADALPETMQSSKSTTHNHDKKKSKATRKTKGVPSLSQQKKEGEKEAAQVTYPVVLGTEKLQYPIAHSPTKASEAAADQDWEEVNEEEAAAPTYDAPQRSSQRKKMVNTQEEEKATAAQAEEKKRKADAKKHRQQQQRRRQQEEDDALLNNVLAHQDAAGEKHEGGALRSPTMDSPTTANTAAAAAAGNTTSCEASSLAHLVMACDAHQLDTRLERIRMFGADAVEDVGDGRTPHRRADGRVRDTGSTSFFPAHHVSIKFMHSAFATPNRYRWPPYDALGVYLTTNEPQGSSSSREYVLDCSSNAFRRAMAELQASEDRMGGVQELVEVLARNKLYHIPGLLQCVYAMEATGQSVFAGELLDVALYQVGVVLRRFALSGTWAARQLPMSKGSNALLFQVLERSVHAALKRGCLRTAFERTRCLLSLDPRDPLGMLLLLDYTALRAKRWIWLLEVRHCLFSGGDTTASDATDRLLARTMKALPTYAFSWALAKHFVEREASRAADASGRASKVLRNMTETQRAMLARTPSAAELVTTAITKFPEATMKLIEAFGGLETFLEVEGDVLPPTDSAWSVEIAGHAVGREGHLEQAQQLADLFVARHYELWKLNECATLLRAAVRQLFRQPPSRPAMDVTSSAVTQHSPLLDPYAYMDLTRESVQGTNVAPIPAELLQPDAAEEEGYLDFADLAHLGLNGHPPTAEEIRALVRAAMPLHADDEDGEQGQAYMEQIFGAFLRRLDEGAADPNALGEAQERIPEVRDWYDFSDGEEEAAEWFSVASGDDRDSEEGA